MNADPAKQLTVMPAHSSGGMTPPILLRSSIDPGRPVTGNGGDGGGGDGGGCTPGLSLLDLSLAVQPLMRYVPVGTLVQLSGAATVRRWLPDCSTHDENAPVQWSLYYKPIGGGGTDATSNLAAPSDAPDNQFTAGLAGTYDVLLTCPAVAAVTSARLYAGRGAVLDGTATAWVQADGLGCRRYATDPSGNPIRFHAEFVTPPGSTQADVFVDTITLPKAVITQTGTGSGTLDLAAGTIEAQLQLQAAVQVTALQATYNGTVSITLSTGAAITSCDGSPVSGSAVSNGTAALAGYAPVADLPVKTECWLEVNANVTPVGWS